jgi:histidine triad (HIT) family protein
MDCLFCKIINKDIPASIVYEDEQCLAFDDINPQAPTHVLIIPKKHIATTNDIAQEDEALVGHLLRVAAQVAKMKGVDESGYRSVVNCNSDAGQEVFHIHVHVLGGRQLAWPPG